MSIALWFKVEQLEKRVQLLEGTRAPVAACRNNAQRRAEGAHLRAAIEEILAAHPDYTAKHVLRALAAIDLGRQELPSVRTVQWHITALRNTSPALRTTNIPQ